MSPTRFPRNAARARRVAAAPLLATMALVAGCGGITLQSTWTESDVTVDGDLADWEGALQRLGDESASVGVRNDSRSIYIALATSDRMTQMQALTHGLTVWFDFDGGQDRTIGVRYPLSLLQLGFSREDLRERRPEPEDLVRMHRYGDGEIEFFRGEEESARLAPLEAKDIEVAIAYARGVLTYELKIPMDGSLFAVAAEPGVEIGLGLETPEIERDAMGARMRRGGGGMGPPGGGRGGMGRGGFGGGRPSPPEPLKVWATARLATPASETPDGGESDTSDTAVPAAVTRIL